MEQLHPENSTREAHELPFAAPCKTLAFNAPLDWLKLGLKDIKRAPKQSLSYGAAMVIISLLVSLIALQFGNFYSLMTMLSGFIFIGPVIAIGLYSVSCQLQLGKPPVLGYCLREGQRHFGSTLLFAMVMLVVFMIWARAASMVHVFFPMQSDASWSEYITFLGIGTAVGAIFSAIIFCAAAFSLPMIMDKKVDMVTAIVTSVNAVLHNKKVMLFWASIIFTSLLIGFATAFIGLLFLMPLIGHATWHAYQETIDASAWPEHD
ncbi:MAG: DUF2189 domain-containing protein [Gammaproteobacteria bacterium]|nr:DUF2189 domain-containing protein [Gammaproteobacteria bacterium]